MGESLLFPNISTSSSVRHKSMPNHDPLGNLSIISLVKLSANEQ